MNGWPRLLAKEPACSSGKDGWWVGDGVVWKIAGAVPVWPTSAVAGGLHGVPGSVVSVTVSLSPLVRSSTAVPPLRHFHAAGPSPVACWPMASATNRLVAWGTLETQQSGQCGISLLSLLLTAGLPCGQRRGLSGLVSSYEGAMALLSLGLLASRGRSRFDEVGTSDVLHLRNFPLLYMCVANGSTDIPHVRGALHCRSIERNSFAFAFAFAFPLGEPVRNQPVSLSAWEPGSL